MTEMRNIMKSNILTIVAAVAFGLAGGPVLAQGMGYGGMGPGMMGGQGYGQMMGGVYDQAWFEALKKKLAITSAQEKPWNAYVAAVNSNTKSMIELHNKTDYPALQKMEQKEQLNFMRSMHEARIDQMTMVIDARDALMKSLDEKQQRLASAALPGTGMMGFGHGPFEGAASKAPPAK
ncbi:conserved hypothetical protein [Candidatus Terasakiella magnetica]|nr:conserved hypothetical protein [Candidatus Terasakiella magnetica]